MNKDSISPSSLLKVPILTIILLNSALLLLLNLQLLLNNLLVWRALPPSGLIMLLAMWLLMLDVIKIPVFAHFVIMILVVIVAWE